MTQATRVHSTPSLNTPSSVPIICAEDQMRAAIRGWLHCSPDRRPSVRALGAHTRKTIEIDYSISQKKKALPGDRPSAIESIKRSGLRLEDESSTDKPATRQQLAALEFEPWVGKLEGGACDCHVALCEIVHSHCLAFSPISTVRWTLNNTAAAKPSRSRKAEPR
jgi:hypothetical protein